MIRLEYTADGESPEQVKRSVISETPAGQADRAYLTANVRQFQLQTLTGWLQ